jgi:hypothetical protein
MSITCAVGSQNAIGQDVPVVDDRWDLGVAERFSVDPGVINGYSSSRARGRSPTTRGLLAGCTIAHGTLIAWCAGVNFLQMIGAKVSLGNGEAVHAEMRRHGKHMAADFARPDSGAESSAESLDSQRSS